MKYPACRGATAPDMPARVVARQRPTCRASGCAGVDRSEAATAALEPVSRGHLIMSTISGIWSDFDEARRPGERRPATAVVHRALLAPLDRSGASPSPNSGQIRLAAALVGKSGRHLGSGEVDAARFRPCPGCCRRRALASGGVTPSLARPARAPRARSSTARVWPGPRSRSRSELSCKRGRVPPT
jgi:hypothetical protein